MKIILFEDEKYKNLLPLVYFRPVWELKCGICNLLQKLLRIYEDDNIFLRGRDYLMELFYTPDKIYHPHSFSESLFINGRLLAGEEDMSNFKNISENGSYLHNDQVVAFRLKTSDPGQYFQNGVLNSVRVLNDTKHTAYESGLISYPWDLIDQNGDQIKQEFTLLSRGGRLEGKIDAGVHLLEKENIFLGQNSRIMSGTVLNGEHGPIWIDEDTRVMPNAVLEGPLAIGKGSTVKIGAKIYENTSIGKVCKVGGEVEETIIQEYSNKQHDGFLGHSYLGAWINIGADTNNSDLKNNYGKISVFLNGKKFNTGKRFLGTIMGDHSKTAINTMLNTGTIVGTNCNIFGEGFPPKFIPSFSWGGSQGLESYRFEKAVEVAKVVMGRRKIDFTEAHKKAFKAVLNLSAETEQKITGN